MLELIIVVAVAGILTAIVSNSFGTAQLRKKQDGIVQAIASHLEKQKADTQAGKGGIAYGVKFATTTYVLYRGTSYNPSTTTNQEIAIDSDFLLTETIANTNNVIYFSKLNGSANETATITISHKTGKVPSRDVVVEATGNVSVIE